MQVRRSKRLDRAAVGAGVHRFLASALGTRGVRAEVVVHLERVASVIEREMEEERGAGGAVLWHAHDVQIDEPLLLPGRKRTRSISIASDDRASGEGGRAVGDVDGAAGAAGAASARKSRKDEKRARKEARDHRREG